MTLQDISTSLADAIETLGPSIVGVRGRRRRGSGVAISEDTIVSALHLLRWANQADVVLPDGEKVKADVVGRDMGTDLAVLRVADAKLTPATLGDTDKLRVGNIVLALGRPGSSVRATFGVVSAKGGAWRSRFGLEVSPYLEVDASLPSGFGGGPLVDASGAVVGLNTPALTRSGATLPVATLRAVVDAAGKDGLRRGYLGVAFQAVELPESLSSQLDGQAQGLLVSSVAEGSPAHAVGVQVGDILVALGEHALTSHGALVSALARSVSTEAELRLSRGGELRDLKVTVSEREQERQRRRRRRCG